jgi:hypothetical protein
VSVADTTYAGESSTALILASRSEPSASIRE